MSTNTPLLPGNRALGFALDYAFPLLLVLLAIGFTLASPGFLSIGNIMGTLHAMAPITVIAAGMAMVVMMGKLDISVGSVAFVSMALAAIAMSEWGFPVWLAALLALTVGAFLGAINGFIVVVLKVNPLIATLGTMIAFRGLALQITNSQVIVLPDQVRGFGNLSIGPVFVDILLALIILVLVHLVHRSTPFGRNLTAIGNDEATAARICIPVKLTVFLAFVAAGFLAAIGGIITAAQVGSVTTFLGRGMEFTAVAVVVVGGISLFGGRGSILWGVLLGALTFELIRSGLNHVGANPYFYELIGGGIIFVAMYGAALKSRKGDATG
jgi:ribose/xylose/arabinose/galactoside ABC-type transport system permease subunit